MLIIGIEQTANVKYRAVQKNKNLLRVKVSILLKFIRLTIV